MSHLGSLIGFEGQPDSAIALQTASLRGLSSALFLENTFDVAMAFRSGGNWEVKRNDGVHPIPCLREFLDAIQLCNAKAVEERMLARFPNHHARQFLSIFTLPAYFSAKGAAE